MLYYRCAMRRCSVMFGMACLATASYLAAEEKPGPSVVVKDCSKTEESCGLPGIDLQTRYKALSSAIVQIGADYYFPVDVLAASFGLEDTGWKFSPHLRFSPHFWSLNRSRMEAVFSRQKRLMLDPDDAPALIAVDVPGIGPRVYDADFIRTLIATELFPYRMLVVSRKRNGARVSFVKLDRGGAKLS